MDKFSDGFSNKSYEDLLEEYAGENLVNQHHAKVRAEEEKKLAEQRKAPAPTPQKAPTQQRRAEPHKPVIQTPSKAPTTQSTPSFWSKSPDTYNRAQNKATTTSQPTSATKNNLDLREVKSFEEEMAEKQRAKRPAVSHAPKSTSDTMEFTKQKGTRNLSKPVIQKANTTNPKKPSKVMQKLPKPAQKAIGKMPKVTGQDMLTAIKKNPTIFAGFTLCILISILISMCVISCINDVLAIGRNDETSIEVQIPNNATTSDAVGALKKAGLIKNRLFCTVFIKAMGYKDDNYLPGVYYLTEDLGVEKMIKRFKTSSVRGKLISITIPEGFTIDKICERLEKNEICTASALYKTIDSVDFSSEYSFIAPIKNKEDRYHVLEGYFFPATYEFEQGADPATVVRTFLNTFQKHWTEEYEKRASELGMSSDDIIILASIIEKEGANKEQFALVSSVLHNRLNRSGLYPLLELNSTKDYVTNTIAGRVTGRVELNHYILNYNTYEKEGLSVGAICNPGEDAIHAALYPEQSQYYFFAHDNNKKIYMAETMEQHDANRRQIAQVNAQKGN